MSFEISLTGAYFLPVSDYVFMLSLDFTSRQPSLIGYTGTPPPLSCTEIVHEITRGECAHRQYLHASKLEQCTVNKSDATVL